MLQVNYLSLCVFILLMMTQSHHQPYLEETTARQKYLARYPQSYYLIQHTVPLQSLSDDTVLALQSLNEPELKFEWSIRLAQQKDYASSTLYWRRYYDDVSNEQRMRLQTLLIEQKSFDGLEKLRAITGLSEKAYALLASEKGTLPSFMSENIRTALNLKLITTEVVFPKECKNRVLLVADHYSAVSKLRQLRMKYNEQPEPAANSFCLSEVFYVGDTMACHVAQNEFAYCHGGRLAQQYGAKLNHVDYVITMTKMGLANVTRGMMTLSTDSDYPIFLHELMHFSGFEDEYAVSKGKARWLCKTSGQYAPNLRVSAQPPKEGWYLSQTCQHGQLNAYKPSSEWGIMQFQELPLSEDYRTLWRRAVESKQYQLPYFSTFAE